MDSEFSSDILDTSSLVTPNININPLMYKISPSTTTVTTSSEDNNNSNSNLLPKIITTAISNNESLSTMSNERKLSEIKNDLKQSFTQQRKPTESPFKIIMKNGLPKMANISVTTTNDNVIPDNVPSTAEVMNDIESFSKYSILENIDRDTTNVILSCDNNFFGISAPPSNMSVVVSPKKKLLIRSQSHTEPTSMSNNQLSQSQKFVSDETNSINNNHHQSTMIDNFQRLHDLSMLTPTFDSNSQLDNHNLKSFSSTTVKLQTSQNNVQPIPIKRRTRAQTNKRTFQQTMTNVTMPSKTDSILISQQPENHEATFNSQPLCIKRQRTASIPIDNVKLSSLSTTNDNNEDQRKKQIRDSNREAARRCRERRRQYIEQLEGNLEHCKFQLKELNEKLSRVENENTRLRTIISEAKLFRTISSLPTTEPIVDFVNVIGTTNRLDPNSETTDGNILPRTYLTRNTHE